MPNKNNLTGWRKVTIFGVALVCTLLLAIFDGLPVEKAADVIKYIALGFFAGNGLEHLGKLIKVK